MRIVVVEAGAGIDAARQGVPARRAVDERPRGARRAVGPVGPGRKERHPGAPVELDDLDRGVSPSAFLVEALSIMIDFEVR